MKGIEKMGIYPVNSDIFPEHVIVPSETTERHSDNYSKNDEVSNYANFKLQPSTQSCCKNHRVKEHVIQLLVSGQKY